MEKEITLNSEIGFADFLSAESTREIVDCHTFSDGNWKQLTRQNNFPENIKKHIFPVNINYANFVVLTEVDPEVKVRPHIHDEPMFRYVLKGTFHLNGKYYEEGDWVFVPAGVPYEMETQTGYTTLGCYGVHCTDPDI